MTSSATFSDDGLYRYDLVRHWDRSKPRLVFVLLNPSTATAETDDPTIRRCMGFAKHWGFGGVTVYNIFALRSTDPKALYGERDPVGPENDIYLSGAHLGHIRIVAAWGNHGRLQQRGDRVLEILRMTPFAFGLTGLGQPKHPLYIPGDAEVHPIEKFR